MYYIKVIKKKYLKEIVYHLLPPDMEGHKKISAHIRSRLSQITCAGSRGFQTYNPLKGKFIRAKGITPIIRNILCPGYIYVPDKRKKSTLEKDFITSKFGGMVRGSIIHHQLELIIERIMTGANGLENFYFKTHEYTKKVIRAFKTWKLTPIMSEAPVSLYSINIATAIDIICCDSDGKLVLIELKTGMESNFSVGNGKMKGPWQALNSPKNQALCQMAIGGAIFEMNTGIKNVRKYVVKVDSSGVYTFEVPKQLEERKFRLLEYISETMSEAHKKSE